MVPGVGAGAGEADLVGGEEDEVDVCVGDVQGGDGVEGGADYVVALFFEGGLEAGW